MTRLMRLTFDVAVAFEEETAEKPSREVCSELLSNIVTEAINNGAVTGSKDFVLVDHQHKVEEIFTDGRPPELVYPTNEGNNTERVA